MDNIKYLTLPIKSLNSVIKFELAQRVPGFRTDSIGCYYKEIYYDFKVTKFMQNFDLYDDLGQNNYIEIHVNQIDIEQNIILCIIFKSSIKLFVLDNNIYSQMKESFSYQHKGNYFQLHTEYKNIKDYCVCPVSLS